MSHYRTGRDFEHRVRDLLERNGYLVLRSAGSKTKIDLACFKPGEALFVQCKRDGRISPAERASIVEAAAWIDAVPVVAYKHIGSSAIHLARLTGVGPKDREPWLVDIEGAA
jgi:Holliday junction resolvase